MKIELKFEELEINLEKKGEHVVMSFTTDKGIVAERETRLMMTASERKELIDSLKILG